MAAMSVTTGSGPWLDTVARPSAWWPVTVRVMGGNGAGVVMWVLAVVEPLCKRFGLERRQRLPVHRGRPQPAHHLFTQPVQRRTSVDPQHTGFTRWWLQGFKLAVHQGWTKKMAWSGGHAGLGGLAAQVQKHEPKAGGGAPKLVAVAVFQRGAGQGDALWGGVQLGFQHAQPPFTVLVGQRGALGHFVAVGRAVEIVPFHQWQTQGLCNRRGQAGFAATRPAHKNHRCCHTAASVAVSAFGAAVLLQFSIKSLGELGTDG